MILIITILNTEYWKPAIGYEGYYEVSSKGRIRAIERANSRGEIIKPYLNKTGYLSVSLSKKGKVKTYRLHKLVALSFIPNEKKLPILNHKDENKANNNVENLEWCTTRYNTLYGKGIYKMRMTRLARTKPIYSYDKSGVVLYKFSNMTEVSKNGFSRGKVWECLSGKRKMYRGLIWRR